MQQTLKNVRIHLIEYRIRITGAKIVAPTAKHRIKGFDYISQIPPAMTAVRELMDSFTHSLHRSLAIHRAGDLSLDASSIA